MKLGDVYYYIETGYMKESDFIITEMSKEFISGYWIYGPGTQNFATFPLDYFLVEFDLYTDIFRGAF